MSSSAYSNFDRDQLNRSHVPAAALGRFCLEGLLPDTHRRIVYLDGDTWIRRDPLALIEASVPEGKLAAVEDMTSFPIQQPDGLWSRGAELLHPASGLSDTTDISTPAF